MDDNNQKQDLTPDEENQSDFLEEDFPEDGFVDADDSDEDEDEEEAEEEDLEEVIPGLVGVADAMEMVNPAGESLKAKFREKQEAKIAKKIAVEKERPAQVEENALGEIPEVLDLTYKASYEDIFSCLNATDRIDGTANMSRRWVMIMGVLAALELIAFMQTRNGFALIMTLIFGGVAIFLQKKGFGVNHKIAKAFEAEEKQTLKLTNDGMEIDGKQVGYNEVVKLYEIDDAYLLIYQKNHTFPIPKRLLSQEESIGLSRKLKGKLGENYEDHCSE